MRFCEECGAPLTRKTSYCESCGRKISFSRMPRTYSAHVLIIIAALTLVVLLIRVFAGQHQSGHIKVQFEHGKFLAI
jgi:predicted amidophosphoribosyltransferase